MATWAGQGISACAESVAASSGRTRMERITLLVPRRREGVFLRAVNDENHSRDRNGEQHADGTKKHASDEYDSNRDQRVYSGLTGGSRRQDETFYDLDDEPDPAYPRQLHQVLISEEV